MEQKNFDNELEEVLQGISKMQEFGDKQRSTNFLDISDQNDLKDNLARSTKRLNLSEVTRQSMRPEAAVWLGFAALISASTQHPKETRRLASKLGGHLARRRARPLGNQFGKYGATSISPRCRKVVGQLHELGCEITEVFGIWIRMKCFIQADEIKKNFGCLWPAINCIEKDNETNILIPRFPERMPITIHEDSVVGRYANISEEGNLCFVFWMDEGVPDLKDLCGIAWSEDGLFPLIHKNGESFF